MKNIYPLLFIFLFLLISGCTRDENLNNIIFTAKGVFVLYEGSFNLGSGDYSYIDLSNNTVANNVYQSSNNNANLGLIPDGMIITGNQNLYITSQGNYGGQGTIFKINASNNQLMSSLNFGRNPYSMTYNSNYIYVTNVGSSFVSKIDFNLSMIRDSIQVGPAPTEIIYALSNFYVSKASYTSENSLAVINEFTDQVTKIYFNAPPVSVANATGGIYVSTYTNKKLYILDSTLSQINDSISMPSSFQRDAIGEIITGGSRYLYVVALDIENFADVGKEIWVVDLIASTPTVSLLIPYVSGQVIYGISYEPYSGSIYIADSRGGSSNGYVYVYNTSGQQQNSFNIGGQFPRRFAFKY